jgi:hypothetical protein
MKKIAGEAGFLHPSARETRTPHGNQRQSTLPPKPEKLVEIASVSPLASA